MIPFRPMTQGERFENQGAEKFADGSAPLIYNEQIAPYVWVEVLWSGDEEKGNLIEGRVQNPESTFWWFGTVAQMAKLTTPLTVDSFKDWEYGGQV